ncbi:MAG: hypothetical protein ACREKK_06625, partial [Candidatus Methylomirabilales bacterium]
MFEQITVERGRCTLCHKYELAVSLPLGGHPHLDGPLMCEGCIRAMQKAADLVRTIRLAKQPKAPPAPKKTRKPRTRQPGAIAGLPDEV